LLGQSGIRPAAALGQNFLIEPAVLDRIVRASDLAARDVVLEIGAGTGELTRRLARRAGCVVAVELDHRLLPLLRKGLSAYDNVRLVQGDILRLDPARLVADATRGQDNLDRGYKVVANLPYYITSAILRHLLEATLMPDVMVLTVQREVAQRLTAAPGGMSILAVSVQLYAEPQVLFNIKPSSFYPSPDVESAVVRLVSRSSPLLAPEEIDVFFRVVRAGFSQRRKQLHNALGAGLGPRVSKHQIAAKLEEVAIDPRRRAQSLSVEEWINLTHALSDTLDT
jgi:16S rRNA (adenine1518-N6/adenine1519-N6)-dimethyltransferase